MNDLSEKEQLDELRAWWQENRAMVLGGVGLGIALILGFRMYTSQQVNEALAASTRYEDLVEAVADGELEPARDIAATLFADYDDTVYARQARLAMARLYMDRGRDADAAEVLRPLATSGGDEPLELVARLRLARILLYQDKPGEVLDLIEVPADSAFASRYHEVLGDAHYALGNLAEAASAWNAALADVRGQQTIDARLIRMKLDDLPDVDGAGSSADVGVPLPTVKPAAADEPAADTVDEDDTSEQDEVEE